MSVYIDFRNWFEQSYKWSEIQWEVFSESIYCKNYTLKQLKEATKKVTSSSNFKPSPEQILSNIVYVSKTENMNIANYEMDIDFRKKFNNNKNTQELSNIIYKKSYEKLSQFEKALIYYCDKYKLDIDKIKNRIEKNEKPFVAISKEFKNKIQENKI